MSVACVKRDDDAWTVNRPWCTRGYCAVRKIRIFMKELTTG